MGDIELSGTAMFRFDTKIFNVDGVFRYEYGLWCLCKDPKEALPHIQTEQDKKTKLFNPTNYAIVTEDERANQDAYQLVKHLAHHLNKPPQFECSHCGIEQAPRSSPRIPLGWFGGEMTYADEWYST